MPPRGGRRAGGGRAAARAAPGPRPAGRKGSTALTAPHATPPRGPRRVTRQALLRDLGRGQPRRLTLIVAPPGYGKTSLAAQWFEKLRAEETRAVWLALEGRHADPAQFLTALLAALRAAGEGGAGRAGDLATLPLGSLAAMVQARVRGLRGPLALFLDDYHLARSPTADGLLAALLGSPHHDRLRLVIVARSAPALPLSALRLAEELRQIGAGELRFSAGEALEFLGDAAARLSPRQIERLMQEAEGWPVALQLVRILVRENAEAAATLEGLGRHPDMGRFLSEQVVSSLRPGLRRFLLATAALPELSSALVEAVTGEAESRAHFAALSDHALPLAHLDEAGHWLRLHPVFRDYLIEEAQRSGIDAGGILTRAARWFEATGDLDRAVGHALAAGAPAMAAAILERAGGWRLMYRAFRGGAPLFRALGDRAGPADLGAAPLTLLGMVILHAKSGRLRAAAHFLRLAERAAGAAGPALARPLRMVRALYCLYADIQPGAAELAALEADLAADPDLEEVHRGLLLNMLSFNFLARTQLEQATVCGELAFRCLEDSGAQFGAMHQHVHVGQAAFFAGNTEAAGESYRRLIDDARTHIGAGCDLEAIGQVLMAELLVQRGDLGGGAAALDWALPHAMHNDCWFDVFAAGFLSRQAAALLAGDWAGAQDAIAAARGWAQRRGFERLRRLVESQQARLLLAAGSPGEAAAWAEQTGMGRATMADRAQNDLALRLRGSVPATFWVRWLTAAGDLRRARAGLDGLRGMQSARLHVPNRIAVDLLDIALMVAEGREAAAAAMLSALVLAVPVADFRTGFRVEWREGLAVLGALTRHAGLPEVVGGRLALIEDRPGAGGGGEAPTRGAPGPGAPGPAPAGVLPADLTPRERGVLHLIGSGRTNKEIGRELRLTENTVKFHTRNIFAKLGVRTRTAALSAAREVGLIV
ncbi:MAG: AAA family ATPase [Rhodobacteraceae bacterium]|nr:AAA family ATPase [Paracoccaceae bacterium]